MPHPAPRHRLHPRPWPLLVLACLGVPAAAAPAWDVDLALHYEDNLTRGQLDTDRLGDTAVEVGGHGSMTLLTTERSSLIGEAGVSTQWWLDYTAVARLAGDGALRYRTRLGADSAAPWLELGLAGSVLRFRDSALRDGAQGRLGITLGQPLSERLSGRVGYVWQVRVADEDTVFDATTQDVFAQLDFAVNDRCLIYGGITVRQGDLVTVALVPNARALRAASAVSKDLDTAFGSAPRRAYRIDGDVVEGEVGINLMLQAGLALDLAATGFTAEADGSNHYHGTGLTLSLLWQFN